MIKIYYFNERKLLVMREIKIKSPKSKLHKGTQTKQFSLIINFIDMS